MKKFAILFVLLTLSLSAFSQEMTCLDKLLPFNRHSGMHQLHREEWPSSSVELTAESAKSALTFLLKSKLLCKPNEVTVAIEPTCTTIITDIQKSKTCFTYTNLGYFILSQDLGRNINFIFSRDNRFSEPRAL